MVFAQFPLNLQNRSATVPQRPAGLPRQGIFPVSTICLHTTYIGEFIHSSLQQSRMATFRSPIKLLKQRTSVIKKKKGIIRGIGQHYHIKKARPAKSTTASQDDLVSEPQLCTQVRSAPHPNCPAKQRSRQYVPTCFHPFFPPKEKKKAAKAHKTGNASDQPKRKRE